MFRFFESRIDPFRDHDDSMPPATLSATTGVIAGRSGPISPR